MDMDATDQHEFLYVEIIRDNPFDLAVPIEVEPIGQG